MRLDARELGRHVAELARGYIDKRMADVDARVKSLEDRPPPSPREEIERETAPLRERVAALEAKEMPPPEIDVDALMQRVTTKLLESA